MNYVKPWKYETGCIAALSRLRGVKRFVEIAQVAERGFRYYAYEKTIYIISSFYNHF
jgi:hypothetical protein